MSELVYVVCVVKISNVRERQTSHVTLRDVLILIDWDLVMFYVYVNVYNGVAWDCVLVLWVLISCIVAHLFCFIHLVWMSYLSSVFNGTTLIAYIVLKWHKVTAHSVMLWKVLSLMNNFHRNMRFRYSVRDLNTGTDLNIGIFTCIAYWQKWLQEYNGMMSATAQWHRYSSYTWSYRMWQAWG